MARRRGKKTWAMLAAVLSLSLTGCGDDGADQAIVDEFEIPGGKPRDVTSAFGSTWVAVGDRLVRADYSGTIGDEIDVSATFVEADDDYLWVSWDDEVQRVDPWEADLVGDPIELGDGRILDLAVGEGHLWALTEDRLWKIEPSTASIAETVTFAGFGSDIAVGEGYVWLIVDTVVRIVDPATLETVGEWTGFDAQGIAVGDGSVWITDETDDAVWRKDPQLEGGSANRISVGNDPRDIVAEDGWVWALNVGGETDTVSAIDAERREAVGGPIEVGEAVEGLAVGPGFAEPAMCTVWTASPELTRLIHRPCFESHGVDVEVDEVDFG